MRVAINNIKNLCNEDWEDMTVDKFQNQLLQALKGVEQMRLRQLWRNNKLVGLKLDRSSQDFIKLDEQLVKLFIEHVNSQIAPSPDKPLQAQYNLYKQA